MAALTITAADVGYVSGPTKVVQVGEAVAQGEPLRELTSDGKYYLCNHTTTTDGGASLVALTPASSDGYVVAAAATAVIDIGATVAIGTCYVVGPTDGDINPLGDLATGDFVTVIGHAVSTSDIKLTFDRLEVAVA